MNTEAVGRHYETVKTVGVNLLALLVVLVLFEVSVRYVVTYNPSYYMGTHAVGSCIPYPYGEVCVNSLGYPDAEFDLSSQKPRVGYFGDSVCYGVGAGQKYRVSDLLKSHYDEYEHFNFCNIGDATLSDQTVGNIQMFADRYKLSHVVVLLNLNDLPPLIGELGDTRIAGMGSQEGSVPPRGVLSLVNLKRWMLPIDERLRGRSYLYTHIRNKIKERLTVAGYGHNGYQSVELFPQANRGVFQYASTKINQLSQELLVKGITFRIVLLPYEMQVSTKAAEAYQRLQISWEPGFERDTAQQMLISFFDPHVLYFDAYHAFDAYRTEAELGEYFVYNKGDKIDWNHPNRAGHRLIAEYLIKYGFFLRR